MEAAKTQREVVEARLGEILAAMPKPKFDITGNGSERGTTGTLPAGIDKKQSHYASLGVKYGFLLLYNAFIGAFGHTFYIFVLHSFSTFYIFSKVFP